MTPTPPSRRRAWLTATALLGVAVFALLLWQGPWWLDGGHLRRHDLQPADGAVVTGFRTTLVAVGAGVVAVFGLYYTHKGHQHTQALFRLTVEEQVTGRYLEAVKLLGSDSTHQRIGGVFGLERIMRDSARDHATVMEVLAAFIRGRSLADDTDRPHLPRRAPEDVQAALTVLGRRPAHPDEPRIDLRHTRLAFARLQEARLRRADLEAADLRGADLIRADLTRADLEHADLRGANLTGADLAGTKLVGADLSGTYGLTAAQLLTARLYPDTVLPPELAADPTIRAARLPA
ncbi:pentapeptide repeat-containing protein [Streptomyces sp. NRRL F-5123]|uniref:pentapeptide repeat-containing protein n=1 Tax=Streptomyces sp. NRRL F-5123 TaxID=1463856 RepID=UPI00069363C6|nr:pentapeptide repeat-containing protein [Streptomyces sp. NRRL F-5123]